MWVNIPYYCETEDDYQKLIAHQDIELSDYLMIENSMRPNILPVLSIGGYTIHVPFHTTWIHEEVKVNHEIQNCSEVSEIIEVVDILAL